MALVQQTHHDKCVHEMQPWSVAIDKTQTDDKVLYNSCTRLEFFFAKQTHRKVWAIASSDKRVVRA